MNISCWHTMKTAAAAVGVTWRKVTHRVSISIPLLCKIVMESVWAGCVWIPQNLSHYYWFHENRKHLVAHSMLIAAQATSFHLSFTNQIHLYICTLNSCMSHRLLSHCHYYGWVYPLSLYLSVCLCLCRSNNHLFTIPQTKTESSVRASDMKSFCFVMHTARASYHECWSIDLDLCISYCVGTNISIYGYYFIGEENAWIRCSCSD